MLNRSARKVLVTCVAAAFLLSTVAPCLADDVGLLFSIPFGKGKSASGCSLNLITGNMAAAAVRMNPVEFHDPVPLNRGYVELPLFNGQSGVYDLMTSKAMTTNQKLLIGVGVAAAFGGAAYLIHEATDDDDDDDASSSGSSGSGGGTGSF